MKRARYRCTETGEVVDVLLAARDTCGIWDISTLPPRPAPAQPPDPWIKYTGGVVSGADFWRAQGHPDGNPFLRHGGA